MKRDKLIKIANNLSNENMVDLISIFANRINIHVGLVNTVCIGGSLDLENPACLNGATIQINMENGLLNEQLDVAHKKGLNY